MLEASILASATSVLALAMLAWRDPMRLRVNARGQQREGGSPAWKPVQRRALATAVLAPGIALAGFGEWAAFAVWIGVLLGSGWILARLFALRRASPHH